MSDQPTNQEKDQNPDERLSELAQKLFNEAKSRKPVEQSPGTTDKQQIIDSLRKMGTSTPSLDQETASKLSNVAKVMYDNFSLIDRDGDKTLSKEELERASQHEQLTQSERELLKSASKNVQLIGGMWAESSNTGKYYNPMLPTHDTGGISRYDIFTMQHALSAAEAPDLFRSRENSWTTKGALAGLVVGAPLTPGFTLIGMMAVEKLAPKLHWSFGAILGGAAYVGLFGGAGALTGRALHGMSYGENPDFYQSKRGELARFKW